MTTSTAVRLVLFDLDGTVADTAPDLGAAVNRCLEQRDRPPLPLSELRPWASHGARGLIQHAFGIGPEDTRYAALRDEFLSHYEADLCRHTRLFPGIEQTLSELEAGGVKWGIVTNKIARLTAPLMRMLGLEQRAACIVSGDTAPRPKPDAAPILHALAHCGSDALASLYVGDDSRDIQAGRAAGVRTVAAAYGYSAAIEDLRLWQADFVIEQPGDLLRQVLPALAPR